MPCQRRQQRERERECEARRSDWGLFERQKKKTRPPTPTRSIAQSRRRRRSLALSFFPPVPASWLSVAPPLLTSEMEGEGELSKCAGRERKDERRRGGSCCPSLSKERWEGEKRKMEERERERGEREQQKRELRAFSTPTVSEMKRQEPPPPPSAASEFVMQKTQCSGSEGRNDRGGGDDGRRWRQSPKNVRR